MRFATMTLRGAGVFACLMGILIGHGALLHRNALAAGTPATQPSAGAAKTGARAIGVCPPFKLRDEAGNIIDPVKGVNAGVPYSPRQTCGAAGCHNYEKITEGFHFQQGKGEPLPKQYGERYRWVSAPGNYGRQLVLAGASVSSACAQDQRLGAHDRHDEFRVRHRDVRQLPSRRRAAGVRPQWQPLRPVHEAAEHDAGR